MDGWRVVETDNFGSDYPNESFVGPVFRSFEAATAVAYAINQDASGPTAYRFWKVVEEGYLLNGGVDLP